MSISVLPKDLCDAAAQLEAECQSHNLAARTIALSDWQRLAEEARRLIPEWLIQLLAGFTLTGPVLTRPHELRHSQMRYFSFWPPEIYVDRIGDYVQRIADPWDITVNDILEDGYTPIADECNGDMWVVKRFGGPSSPVYLFDVSALKKIQMSDTMAQFLKSLKVRSG